MDWLHQVSEVNLINASTYNFKLALIHALSTAISYEYHTEKQALMSKAKVDYFVASDHKKAILEKDAEDLIQKLTLLFMLSNLKGTGPKGYGGNEVDAIKYKLALNLFPFETQEIINTQMAKRSTRKDKIKARIKELKGLLAKAK